MSHAKSGSSFVTTRMAVILGITAIIIAARLYAPHADQGPILCPLHAFAGLPCPGCGITRALCGIASGDFSAAVRLNALSIPVAIALVVAAAVCAYELVTRRTARWPRTLLSPRAAWLVAAVIVIYHGSRVGVGLHTGSLARDYLRTSYTYQLTHFHSPHRAPTASAR